jgi:hypothetical protein
MSEHEGLPVHGYQRQSDYNVQLVNKNKEVEERILREIDALMKSGDADPRWLSIAKTHFEEGFMAYNRSIFKPQRVRLPEDN